MIFFFPGLCVLSLGFNTENDFAPGGLTSQGIECREQLSLLFVLCCQ